MEDVFDSSSESNDVIWDSSAQEKVVPYERFAEVNAEKNSYKEMVEELESRLGNIEEKFSPKPVRTENEIPDVYENPKAYAEWIKNQTISEIMNQKHQEQQAQQAEVQRIEQEIESIKKLNPWLTINEDAIGEFAIEYDLRNEDWWYDLIKAFNLYQKINWQSQGQPSTRDRIAPVWANSITRTPSNIVTQDTLRQLNKSWGLTQFIASQWH